jgi:hypothetical protein
MFENLKIIGEAFKSFGKKDDEVEIDQRSSIEKLDDFNMEDDIFSATQSRKVKIFNQLMNFKYRIKKRCFNKRRKRKIRIEKIV